MAQPRARTGGRWLLRSLASRLVLVSLVFIAVPILIYQQFRAADEDKQTLLLQSAQQQGQLIARALEPLLAKADASLLPRLGEVGRVAIVLRARNRDTAAPTDFLALALIALSYTFANEIGAVCAAHQPQLERPGRAVPEHD